MSGNENSNAPSLDQKTLVEICFTRALTAVIVALSTATTTEQVQDSAQLLQNLKNDLEKDNSFFNR